MHLPIELNNFSIDQLLYFVRFFTNFNRLIYIKMKKTLKLGFGMCILFIGLSCTSHTPKQEKELTKTVAKDTVKQCYTAIFEHDTAKMEIGIIDQIKVIGSLKIHYADKPQNQGTFKGSFKGDTLYVDYSFKTGNNPQEFINPLAFLKQGDSLSMGVGVIETYMGRSYFAKDKPINYTAGKFVFSPTDCK